MSEIRKRKFKCTGCGEARPCYLETNKESSIFDLYTEDKLTCVLDATNRTGFNWEEVEANGVSDNHEKALPINSVVKVESSGTSVFCPECGCELLYVEHDKCTTEGCKNCIF